MNHITFRKVIRDIASAFDGLTWALSGDIAYSVLVDDEPASDHIDMLLKLNQYGKAGMRLEQEPVTNIGENGRKTFSLETEYREIPVNIVTTSIDKHLEVLQNTETVEIGDRSYDIVPPAYLAAIFADTDADTTRIDRLREETEFDEEYLKRCIRALGLERKEVTQ